MTSYPRPKERPLGKFDGFHHFEFYVSNAKQAADWMILRMGFTRVAYKGLETGCRERCSHAIKQGKIFIVYTSTLEPKKNEITDYLEQRGDSVKDVAFNVDDCKGIYEKAIKRGAKSVNAPKEYKDKYGSVIMASLETYGACIHTLIENVDYKGVFLPGFDAIDTIDPLASKLAKVGLEIIDHCVGNQPGGKMVEVAEWYKNMLDFHQFWSVDDTQIHTEYSALKSIVMTDFDRTVKMPINEPAKGKKKSQIQEYVDYHGGPGVQHIALKTNDIVTAITNLKSRGMKFLTIPTKYYTNLRERLKNSPTEVKEDLAEIEKLNILVDFDDQGYLLQIFTQPVEDRPTLFYEVIQRRNHDGFGAGNFKALFESIEHDQAKRGNLTDIVDSTTDNVLSDAAEDGGADDGKNETKEPN